MWGGGQDFGFRAYRLTTSNFKPWDREPPKGQIARQLEAFSDNVLPDRTDEDLLTEVLLTAGLPLTTPVERLTLAGKTVFSLADGVWLVCLERDLTIEAVEAMAARDPDKIICLDAGFATDQVKANAAQTIRAHRRDGDASSIQLQVL